MFETNDLLEYGRNAAFAGFAGYVVTRALGLRDPVYWGTFSSVGSIPLTFWLANGSDVNRRSNRKPKLSKERNHRQKK